MGIAPRHPWLCCAVLRRRRLATNRPQNINDIAVRKKTHRRMWHRHKDLVKHDVIETDVNHTEFRETLY